MKKIHFMRKIPSCYVAILSIESLVIAYIYHFFDKSFNCFWWLFGILMLVIYTVAMWYEVKLTVQNKICRCAVAVLSIPVHPLFPLPLIVLAIWKHCWRGCSFFIILQLLIFNIPAVTYAPEARWMALLPFLVILPVFYAGIIALYYELRKEKSEENPI